MRRYTAKYMEWRRDLGMINRLISNVSYEHVLENVMCFHFLNCPGMFPGASFERVLDLSQVRDGIGSRAVRSVLALAETAGWVLVKRGLIDKRQKLFEPTETLLNMMRDLCSLPLGILDDMNGNYIIHQKLYKDPDFIRFVFTRLGEVYVINPEYDPHLETNVYENLQRMDGGPSLIATSLVCSWMGRDLPTAQDLAKHYYVSASQIRFVMAYADSVGLIKTGYRGRLMGTDALEEAYVDALCHDLALFADRVLDLDVGVFERAAL